MAQIQNLDALEASLSSNATVDLKGGANYPISASRWSDLHTPNPGAVVNISTEQDVATTVSIGHRARLDATYYYPLIEANTIPFLPGLVGRMGNAKQGPIRGPIWRACLGELVQH
jgi:hypothetical protein